MTFRPLRFLLPLALVLLALSQAPPGVGPHYVPEQPGAIRLQVKRVRVLARDRENLPIPAVAVSLFEENAAHRMLTIGATGQNGRYDFGSRIPPGEYQLAAQYPGLCSVNVPVTVTPRARHSLIVLRMAYPGLGACGATAR